MKTRVPTNALAKDIIATINGESGVNKNKTKPIPPSTVGKNTILKKVDIILNIIKVVKAQCKIKFFLLLEML